MGRGFSGSIRGLFILWALCPLTAFTQAPTPNTPRSAIKPSAAAELELTQRYCDSLLPGDSHADPLHQACMFALTLNDRLPNFQCQMQIVKEVRARDNRYILNPLKTIQRVTARARYVDGKDYYDDIKINGQRPTDNRALKTGTWSTGEFGMRISAAFAPQVVPDLKFVQETSINRTPALEYQFSVTTENNSVWRWVFDSDDAHSGDSDQVAVHPGYTGKVWLAKSGARILRLEMKSTDGVPKTFPVASEATRTDFAYVKFQDGTGFLLPSTVQSDIEMRGFYAYRHLTTFTKCQKFRGTGRIITDPVQ